MTKSLCAAIAIIGAFLGFIFGVYFGSEAEKTQQELLQQAADEGAEREARRQIICTAYRDWAEKAQATSSGMEDYCH